jgi:hypothetical protein
LASALKLIVASRKPQKNKPDPAEKIELLESMFLSHGVDKQTLINEVATCIALEEHYGDLKIA